MNKTAENILRNCASWGVMAEPLARTAGVATSTAEKHLRDLRRAGLVERSHQEHNGETITVYRATGEGARALSHIAQMRRKALRDA